ncbi:hypothetical protein M438DRAFT_53054 [Aureobasidium pullulans EXF-150]|uniref:Uncharacterized protein n=1 Tax=Aureobasidium pullulans EXF-150 TaxID=1043002 RepID=A0A074XKF3_AURPU|nr:uncharacterized protein M438DRAFT_53054 [Aureobasidium pullulans EXF-150]KEQ82507.1 hypothetical protein M438DRAFT_53054 [Aureobasidium pullulans EXF-150]
MQGVSAPVSAACMATVDWSFDRRSRGKMADGRKARVVRAQSLILIAVAWSQSWCERCTWLCFPITWKVRLERSGVH